MSRRKREVSLDGLVAHLESPGDSRLYSDGRRGERKIIASIDPPPIPMDTPMWRCYQNARRVIKRRFRSDGAKAAISGQKRITKDDVRQVLADSTGLPVKTLSAEDRDGSSGREFSDGESG